MEGLNTSHPIKPSKEGERKAAREFLAAASELAAGLAVLRKHEGIRNITSSDQRSSSHSGSQRVPTSVAS